MLRIGIVALACVGLGGCLGGEAEEPGTPALPFHRGGPIPCNSDADCPPLACGPCTPGTVVSRGAAEINCHHDPCIDGGSVCGAARLCVVQESARKDPGVWCRRCAQLEADAASICARAETKAACEKKLAEAVSSCDDERCTAARASVRTRTVRDDTDADPPVNDELSAAEVVEGFEKARSAVLECPDAVPGLEVRIRADINAKGKVLAAAAEGPNRRLPIGACAAQAVKKRARFAPTTRPLQSKHFTYEF